MTFSIKARLNALARDSRAVVNAFQPDEKLYLRVPADHLLLRRDLMSEIEESFNLLQFPEHSVTRDGVCSVIPEDALLLISSERGYERWYGDHGVVHIEVRMLPSQAISDAAGSEYRCRPVHDPYEANYAHSNIRHEPVHHGKGSTSISKTARHHFRKYMSHVLIKAMKTGYQLVDRRPGEIAFEEDLA